MSATPVPEGQDGRPTIGPRERELIDAIWRWRASGEPPDSPEELRVVGLATCCQALLAMAKCDDPVDAWMQLDEAGVVAVTQWWAYPPESGLTAQLPHPASRDGLIVDPITLRKARGESQAVFWERLGSDQSCGSRYESRSGAPAPMRILFALFVRDHVSPKQLWRWGQLCDGKPSGLGEEVDRRIGASLADIAAARRQRSELQREFWSRFGMRQSNGSRCEAGQEVYRPLQLLMVGYWLGELDDAVLAEHRRLALLE